MSDTVETPTRSTVRRNTSGLRPPWQKGVSGNPNGRPKKKPVTEAYEKALEDPETAQAIALGIIAAAQAGDVQAAREIADRLEGRVPQNVAVEGSLNISALLLAAFAHARNGNGQK